MKPLLKYSLYVFLYLYGWAASAFGQQFNFNKLIPPNGKTFSHVNDIAQDANGYMWFCTEDGLYSYNGYQFTWYKNDPLNTNSLSSDTVNSIAFDFEGEIWLGTNHGLDRFDTGTGQFKHYRHNPENSKSINGDWVGNLMVDREGILWASSDVLERYDKQTDSFIHYRNIPGDSTSLSCDDISSIYEDRQGTIWVGTGSVWNEGEKYKEGGLNRMDKKNGTFTRYMHDPNNQNSLINNIVTAIYEDSKGTFWVGTAGDGLHTMNREKGTFIRHIYDPKQPEKLSRPPYNHLSQEFQRWENITFINEDISGGIWIGTRMTGMIRYDPATGITTNFDSNKDFESDQRDKMPTCFYTSKEGEIWIGTVIGNIYRIDPFEKVLPHFVTTGGGVLSFNEEPDGTFWMVTDRELIRSKKTKSIQKREIIDENPILGNANAAKTIKTDRQGNIWLGTKDGLFRWDMKIEKFIHFKIHTKNEGWLCRNVFSIYEERESNLWIGNAKGLGLLDYKTDSLRLFQPYPSDTVQFGKNAVTSVLQDKSGKLWIGAWGGGGLNLFNRETKKFKNYLPNKSISGIYEDSDGILWVGSWEDLYRFDRNSDTFISYTDSTTLSGISRIVSVIEDNQKYLWVGTVNGIARINPQRNGTFILGKDYGIDPGVLRFNTAFKGQHGELYFGDETGYFFI